VKTLIRGGYVVGFNGRSHEILKGGEVVIDGDKISFVGFGYPGPADKTVDAGGKLVSPGFVNSHIHPNSNAGDYFLNDPDKTDYLGSNYLTFMTSRRGAKKPVGLEDFRVGGKFCLAQLIKSGCTTAFIYGPGGPRADDFAALIGEIGLRAFVSPAYRSVEFQYDENGALRYGWDEALGERGLDQAAAFIRKHQGSHNGRLQGMLFPRQPDTCTPALLKRTKETARDLGVPIQLHAAINLIEVHEILRTHGKTPIAFLRDLGFLGPEVLLGHCIFLTGHSWTLLPRGDELAMIADSGASVAHCPLKYLKLGIVLESLDRYVARGVNVALGTDTYPVDLIHEMRVATLAARFAEKDYLAGSYRDVFNAATLAGAKSVGRDDLGRLSPGAKADVIIVNLSKIEVGAVFDPIKALVEYGSGRDIETVIIDGITRVEQGRIVGLDESKLLAQVQEEAERIWARLPEWDLRARTAEQVSPWAFPVKTE
jgi:5-methylthioadenosine/S-adenosylhomocysteine deaminase